MRCETEEVLSRGKYQTEHPPVKAVVRSPWVIIEQDTPSVLEVSEW